MIYCVSPHLFPTPDITLEYIEYKDLNDLTWQVSRVSNGFFVRYAGDPYFKENYFQCEMKGVRSKCGFVINQPITLLINNTNCIFIKTDDFEMFVSVRTIIRESYTDDIWEAFGKMFETRLESDMTLLISEIYKG